MTTKRTMGQCTCRKYLPHQTLEGHAPDCPALYPLQRQPGDEKDALTRLVAHIQGVYANTWQDEALDLVLAVRADIATGLRAVSDARLATAQSEERAARLEAERDRACDALEQRRIERDGANERARMLLDAKNDIADDLRQKVSALEHELAKTMDTLLDTQRGMGEARQQNLDEGREQGHLDAFLWLRAHHKGILAPTADGMRAALAEMMDSE